MRAEFTDFSDLNAILERALLIWTPDLPIKEKKDAFIADRRAASEADARRLLYVALKRLILDHKSGAGSFAGYLAQLDAYRSVLAEHVEAIKPDVAIHWIDRAEVEVFFEEE